MVPASSAEVMGLRVKATRKAAAANRDVRFVVMGSPYP
jgi:hypothetical protein